MRSSSVAFLRKPRHQKRPTGIIGGGQPVEVCFRSNARDPDDMERPSRNRPLSPARIDPLSDHQQSLTALYSASIARTSPEPTQAGPGRDRRDELQDFEQRAGTNIGSSEAELTKAKGLMIQYDLIDVPVAQSRSELLLRFWLWVVRTELSCYRSITIYMSG